MGVFKAVGWSEPNSVRLLDHDLVHFRGLFVCASMSMVTTPSFESKTRICSGIKSLKHENNQALTTDDSVQNSKYVYIVSQVYFAVRVEAALFRIE